jgi:hypothetical protein
MCSSETSVLTRPRRRQSQEDGILHVLNSRFLFKIPFQSFYIFQSVWPTLYITVVVMLEAAVFGVTFCNKRRAIGRYNTMLRNVVLYAFYRRRYFDSTEISYHIYILNGRTSVGWEWNQVHYYCGHLLVYCTSPE